MRHNLPVELVLVYPANMRYNLPVNLVLVYMASLRYNLPVYLMLVYMASMRYNLPNIACCIPLLERIAGLKCSFIRKLSK